MARNDRGPQTIPVDISGGQYSGGDASLIPPDRVRRLRNLVWEDAWVSRPPFTYDNVTAVRGLKNWSDETNGARRLLSVDSSRVVRVKGTTGETWSASVGTVINDSTGILDSTNYRGQIFFSTHNSSDTPLAFYSYDTTALSRLRLNGYVATPGIFPYTLTSYKERLFFGGVYYTWRNFLASNGIETDQAFNPSNWTLADVTASSAAVGSATLYTVTPTNTTTASLTGRSQNNLSFSDANDHQCFRCELRGTHPTYEMPITVQLKYTLAWSTGSVVAVGEIVVPTTANGSRYRCITAGTTDAATEPVWTTTVGATFADGTATWMCDGSDIAAQVETYVPTSDVTEWSAVTVIAKIPANANTSVAPVIKFGTASAATITLAPVEFAFKDGLAEGNPRKRSHGQQLTFGFFEFPFHNKDEAYSSSISTLARRDYIAWTEPGEPEIGRAQNVYALRDVPGPITKIMVAQERLLVFKRAARWVFGSNEDPDTPVLPEGDAIIGAGCLNAAAGDVSDLDGAVYTIGENGFYRWTVGSEPVELCGEAMLRRVFNKSTASWVESQAAPANRALLTIDQRNHRALLYTQKGLIFIYDLRRKTWSEMDAGGGTTVAPVGYQICDMIYNPGTGNVVVAFTEASAGTAGIARLDATQSAANDQISSSGTLTIHHDIWLRPIETKPRSDVMVDYIRADIECTIAGQTATAYFSINQGGTFTATSTPRSLLTDTTNYAPERFYIGEGYGTIMPRLLVSGKAGSGALKLSGVSVDVIARKVPEYHKRSA